MERLFTPEQVATKLFVEITTVYTWLQSGRLSGVKLGRLWRVSESDLRKFTTKGWKQSSATNSEQTKAPEPNDEKTAAGSKKSQSEKRARSAKSGWVDALPQIDLSGVYEPDTIFSREEILDDGNGE